MAHCLAMQAAPGSSVTELPLLSVVDDDQSVRESLPDLLAEFGFATRAFSSAEEFLSSDCIAKTKCLILDVVMPKMSGLELYQELKRRGLNLPVVFITAQRDEAVRVRMLAQGAAGFLLKPFSETDLLAAVRVGLRRD